MSGYIYKITCKNGEIHDCYVGSTRDTRNRFYNHKQLCLTKKDRKLYNFMNENGGFDNWRFTVIDTIEGDNQSLLRAERYWFDKLTPTLNNNGIHLTQNEKYINHKKSVHQYYIKNRDAIIKRSMQYRENNMDAYKDYQKQYREKNHDALCAKLRAKSNCECGGKFTYSNRLKHAETARHKRYLQNQNEPTLSTSPEQKSASSSDESSLQSTL